MREITCSPLKIIGLNMIKSMNQKYFSYKDGCNLDGVNNGELQNINIQSRSPNKPTDDSDNGTKSTRFDVLEYIEDAIKNGMKNSNICVGRPKQEFDTSPCKIQKFYQEYSIHLEKLIEANYSQKRSDTFRNTIFSYLKKLPIKLREMSCSISEPKSKKLSNYLNAFLTAFINCFLPYFKNEDTKISTVELFLYFI
jgi:hypothetical protein